MEAAEALTFAQRRERLAFRWMIGAATTSMVSVLVLVIAWSSGDDWEEPATSIGIIALLASLLSAMAAFVSFIAWLVGMAKRRRLEASAFHSH